MGKSIENPMGMDGFEFVEYTAEDSRSLERLFLQMGFSAVARHRSKDVVVYRQGGINFILNHESDCFAREFARAHGPAVCAIGLRVHDSAQALSQALAMGAREFEGHPGPMELNIPAIYGVGDSLIYLIDRYGDSSIYEVDFVKLPVEAPGTGQVGLQLVDHLTNNVHEGCMDQWSGFYQQIFNFREIRYFDIHGHKTGLRSRAMISPCGKVRIPINEPTDRKSQIQEYLDLYHGEGVQHIALTSDDIYSTVETLRSNGMEFMQVPDSYYESVNERLPWQREDLERMHRNQILIDGGRREEGGLLLQIFTQTVIGPIFFEIIQRKGHEGFGEGNFQALFEAMERDQARRGVL
jgi:4-hydroxyphenylpyruvate dioxygenase